MNKRKLNTLSNELIEVGAKETERKALLQLASQLQLLRTPLSSRRTTARRAAGGRLACLVWPGLSVALGFIIGMSVVGVAQPSLPGSWLYPVKRASETAAAVLHPGYQETIMMRRAQEVQELVHNHASSPRVLAALTAYQTAAANYRSKATNYSAFEYCKSSLEQAETQARGAQQQSIRAVLASLQDV